MCVCICALDVDVGVYGCAHTQHVCGGQLERVTYHVALLVPGVKLR